MSNTMQNARDAAGNAADKAKEMASSAVNRTKEVASNVADSARDMGSRAGQKADSVLDRAGSALETAADKVRDYAPQGGTFGHAGNRVADTLESGGRYLREEGIGGIAEDVTDLIKRNPIPALLVGLGVGYLLARALGSSRS